MSWDKFTDGDWERFNQTLRRLPEVREADGGAYAWYSADADPEGGYIFGSVEPPGLHVYGSIDLRRLSTWHVAFQRAIVEYPLRTDMDWATEACSKATARGRMTYDEEPCEGTNDAEAFVIR